MALPRTAPSSWMQSLDFPSRLFETGSNDYELYEEDDERITAEYTNGVLEVRLPVEETTVTGREIELHS